MFSDQFGRPTKVVRCGSRTLQVQKHCIMEQPIANYIFLLAQWCLSMLNKYNSSEPPVFDTAMFDHLNPIIIK